MQRATPSEPQRHLRLDGTYNVRDIGGYRTHDGRVTRWQTLFRADSLHRLPPAAQRILLDHGLRLVLDLRRSDELRAAPNVFTALPGVQYLHLSLLTDTLPVVNGDPQPLVDTYRYILDERQAQVYQALATLATPGNLPAVVHCTAGKDRTGVIIALALALAGVPAATIVADYALTATCLGEPFMEESRRRALQRGYTWEQYKPLVGCPPDYMETTLQHLETQYGGIDAYVRRIGLHEAQLAYLRTALVA